MRGKSAHRCVTGVTFGVHVLYAMSVVVSAVHS